MIDVLRLLAAWGIVFYHTNFPQMHHVSIGWLPWVRDTLFGWALPFFYASSAYSILTYLQSGKPRWKLWSKYASHLCLLIVIYQMVRIVGMHQAVLPCSFSLSCWIDVLRTGNHSIGYYLFDWLVFFAAALVSTKIHTKYGPLMLGVLGIVCLLLGLNPLFERQTALWGFTVGIGLYEFLIRWPQLWLTQNKPSYRHISYYIYVIHPFVYMATDRVIPRLLPKLSIDWMGAVIILSTIMVSTALSAGFEQWHRGRQSSV